MTLCPGMAAFVEEVAKIYEGHSANETIAEQRARYDLYSARFAQARPAGIVSEDREVAVGARSVRVRIYRARAALGLQPGILFMHGGGWVLGSIGSHDCVAAQIADATGAVVISVEYRLAPEHPFPAAFEDCNGVMLALVRDGAAFGVDSGCLVVAGDSAGGNLAAALAIAARDEAGIALAGQVLIYPVLSEAFNMPSHVTNADAPMLKTADMRIFWRHYLGGAEIARDVYAAPLLATSVAGLPPAFITTAGFDPARDDGDAYAQRLREAGVAVTYRCDDDLAHGYLRSRGMSTSAAAAFAAICAALAEMTAAA